MKYFTQFKDFYGKDGEGRIQLVNQMFQLAAEIRRNLGEQGHLIETYLLDFLGAARPLYVTPASDGMDNRERVNYSAGVCTGSMVDGSLYGLTKRYRQTHLLGYTPGAQSKLYAVALFPKYFSHRMRERRGFYREQLRGRLNTRDFDLMREKISEIVGQEPMDRLHELLWQVFLPIPPLSIFMQHLRVSLMSDLLVTDEESGRPVLSLWLDAIEKGAR